MKSVMPNMRRHYHGGELSVAEPISFGMSRMWCASVCIALTLSALSGCDHGEGIVELPRLFSTHDPSSVPIVLVGQALEHCHAVDVGHPSRWDGRPMQLWAVKVKVEHVLQGELQEKIVDIFYYVDTGAGSFSFSRVLDIYKGHSEIFFLMRDGRSLRTICDGSRSCVIWVRTGSHPYFHPPPRYSIEETILDLLLSRGERTTDQEMTDAIYHLDLRWGWSPAIKRLRELAQDRSPMIRAAAIDRLRYADSKYLPVTDEHQKLN